MRFTMTLVVIATGLLLTTGYALAESAQQKKMKSCNAEASRWVLRLSGSANPSVPMERRAAATSPPPSAWPSYCLSWRADVAMSDPVIEAAKEVGVDPARALKAAGIDDPLGSLKTRN
jgi:short subunit fatty acids transporter